MSKETWYRVKRDLVSVERDLVPCQKRPSECQDASTGSLGGASGQASTDGGVECGGQAEAQRPSF